MRSAGEAAYVQLIDFTTTVSWRPRYLSFLSWAVKRAWHAAGGRDGEEFHRVDRAAFNRAVKRRDYVFAAASLIVDPEA